MQNLRVQAYELLRVESENQERINAMKHISRKVATAIVATTLALSMTACTGGGSKGTKDVANIKKQEVAGEISFQTWSLKNDKFTPYFTKVIADFEKKYPKVKIKWMDQPGDGYEDKLLQQANSDQLPDVVNIPPEYGAPLAKAGKLLDLKAADEKTLTEYVKGGIEAYQYHGIKGSYAYPWYLGVSFNYWNQDALKKAGLDKPPASEAEFIAAAEKAAKAGVALVNTAPHAGFIASRGVKIWNPETRKFNFNTPEAIKVVETYKKLYQEKAMLPEIITQIDNGQPANEAFYKGTMGAIQSTPSFADNLKKEAPSLVDKVIPTEPWEEVQLLAQGIAVSANSKHPAAALAFAQFVTNTDNQVAFVKLAKGFMPGTLAGNANPQSFASENDSKLLKEALAVSAKTITKAKMLTPLEMSNEMKTVVLQQVSLALQGSITVEKALATATEKCNKLMEATQ